MILIDTSIWIDHIRSRNGALITLLGQAGVTQHPFVTAEVALGSLANRSIVIEHLKALPPAPVVSNEALLDFVEQTELAAQGIGLVDAHLLASSSAMEGARLWSRDKRLARQAERLGLAYEP